MDKWVYGAYLKMLQLKRKEVNMKNKKINLGHGYTIEYGYHKEGEKTFFFVDVTKDGENLVYDSKLLKEVK